MKTNNLSKAIPVRLTSDQNKALEKLKHVGFKKSLIIRIAIDEYLHKNYRQIMADYNRVKCPF